MTLYRHIFKEALKTAWHHKYLWFFGLFAALIGNSGELEIIFRGLNGSPGTGFFPGLSNLGQTGIFNLNIFSNLAQLSRSDPFSLFIALGAFLLIVTLSLFLVWLSVTSQAALVNNVARAKADRKHNFKQGLTAGTKYFWPVFGLHVLLRIILYIAFILLSLPIAVSASQPELTSVSLLFILSFIVFVPLGIILSFIIKYAVAYVVIKGSKFTQSIKLGWQLFTRNWLVSIEMAFLLFFINFVVGLGIIILLLVFTVPFLFIAIVLSQLTFYFNFFIIMVSALILYVGIIAIVGAMLSTFNVASWTGLYIDLISKGGVSKLVRIVGKE
jgi:hypothetical protein